VKSEEPVEPEIKKIQASLIMIEKDNKCPECDSESLIKEARCTTCLQCGWSKCDI
jgi:hypothetical protein